MHLTSENPPTGYTPLDQLIRDKAPQVHDDRQSWDWFLEDQDRYAFDWGLPSGPEGDPAAWHQFDTRSDAAYFGIWIQRRDHLILRWTEGDLSLVRYSTEEAYDEALLRLCRSYSPVPRVTTFDTETKEVTHHFEDRRPLFYDPKKLDAIDDGD